MRTMTSSRMSGGKKEEEWRAKSKKLFVEGKKLVGEDRLDEGGKQLGRVERRGIVEKR